MSNETAKRKAKRKPNIEFKARDDATKKSTNTYAVLVDGVHVLDAVFGDQRQQNKYRRRGNLNGYIHKGNWHLITICHVKLSDGREIKHPSVCSVMRYIDYLEEKMAERPDVCADLVACAKKAEAKLNKMKKKRKKRKKRNLMAIEDRSYEPATTLLEG